MEMRHFFAGEEMRMFPMMFPMFIVFLFLAMMAVRVLIFGQAGFGSMSRGYGMRRSSIRRRMFLGEAEEKSSPYSSAQGKNQINSAKPSAKENTHRSARQAHLARARIYKEQIDNLIKSASGRKASIRLQDLTVQVSEWVKAIEALTQRIDSFDQNTLILQDLESVPKSIKELEMRLAHESNETIRIELDRTLTSRKNQLAALERLQGARNRVEIKIESTLSALGTIYSQILTAQSTDQIADYSRLSVDVDEEVRTLQDYLEALAEVKLSSV